MSDIAWKARVFDLQTNSTIATSTELIAPSYGSTLDSYGRFHVEFRPGTAICNAILESIGAPTYTSKPLMRICELSQDNGATWDTGMWIEKGRINFGGANGGIVLDGFDLFSGYDRAFLDEATYVDIKITDVLSAPAGQVAVNSNNLLLAGGFLPIWWDGLFNHVPGRTLPGSEILRFTAYTHSTLAQQKVDLDINSTSIYNALGDVIKTGAGIYDSSNPALFGADQHFSVDYLNKSVFAGYKGNTPSLILTNLKKPSQVDETVEASIIDAEEAGIDFNLDSWLAQTEFVFGSSTHNMPDGGTFTGAVMINKPANGESTARYADLLLVSITTTDGGGGVYTWLGDGALRQMSQTIDVNDLKLDGTDPQKLYMATRLGLFTRGVDGPYTSVPWTRCGDKTCEFTKVWIPESGIVYAVASGANNGDAINGVYRFDVGAGTWTRVVLNGTIIDASGSDSSFYYVDDTAPSTITHSNYPASGAGTAIDVPEGAHVIGLDFDAFAGEVVVRTELGAAGLYRISGDTITKVDPSGSLADGFGPLSVAQFIDYQGTINGQPVHGMVSSDRGIWWRGSATGPFHPTDGQSGLQNVNSGWLAIGGGHTVMGRPVKPIAAVAANEIYLSWDGGLHWDAVISKRGDCGPAWYEIVRNITGDYPDGTVGAYGSVITGDSSGTPSFGPDDTAPTDPEGNGIVVLVPAGSIWSLPDNWLVARRWTTNNTYTYRLVDTQSPAPYNAMKPGEESSITADNARSVVAASYACLRGAYRYLAQASKPQISLAANIRQGTQESAARTLLCGDLVNVTYLVSFLGADDVTTSVFIDMTDQPMYVIDKQGHLGGTGEWEWDLLLVNEAVYNLLDIEVVVRALANGQAQDRRLNKKVR